MVGDHRHPQHRLGDVARRAAATSARRRSSAASSSAPSAPSRSSPSSVVEERDALGRRLERRLLAKRCERRGELQQRVVAERRDRGVAGAPAGAQVEAVDALLADAEGVEAPAAELERSAAALVDDQVAAHRVGVLARTATWRPSAAPISSSAVITSFSAPRAGRQPDAASAIAAATSAATWPFMSWAPRPRTSPSTTSPDQGLKLHSSGSAGTVSTWPSRQSVGPSASPRGRRPGSGGPGSAASSSHSKPASRRRVGEQLLTRLLVAGRVDGVERGSARGAGRPPRRRARSRRDRRLLAHRPRLPRPGLPYWAR